MIKKHNEMPYAKLLKTLNTDAQNLLSEINSITGVKESDTGLAPPALWDLNKDKTIVMRKWLFLIFVSILWKFLCFDLDEAPLQVAQCTKIIKPENGQGPNKYIINIKQFAKFVVDLGKKLAPTDVEEGMRVGVDRSKYQIQIPLQ